MKPVLILQHLSTDGPAYLATWLDRRGVSFEVFDTQAGQDFPQRIDGYGALAVLGGEMSANDPLPSLRRAESLILQAIDLGRPVIGHCLGGQLMARALGGRVHRAPAPEIGWQAIEVADHPEAVAWFGASGTRHVFQWHEEAFELPPGAVALAGSSACRHQAFALGAHLAMQFHVEVDEAKLLRWTAVETAAHRQAQRLHATVQDNAAMRAGIGEHLQAHQALADRIYARWLHELLQAD